MSSSSSVQSGGEKETKDMPQGRVERATKRYELRGLNNETHLDLALKAHYVQNAFQIPTSETVRCLIILT